MSSPSVAVPNISEGRDEGVIRELQTTARRAGARVVDVHSDPIHNRSVFTLSGADDDLVNASAQLARACRAIDLQSHAGVHPRLGSLDVMPFVVVDGTEGPVAAARRAAEAIWSVAGLPVYLYGLAARRPETRNLPDLRRGGLRELARRARLDLPPDVGTPDIDPGSGVVCVGARPPLVAFNVSLAAGEEVARRIASRVRTSGGGPPGIRALGLPTDARTSQVSMNLTSPDETGIERAFDEVEAHARAEDADVISCEIVGVPLARHLPHPNSRAARLLAEPGRSLESVLQKSSS